MAGPAPAGLFIYAKDLNRLTHFYESLLGMTCVHESVDIAVLNSPGLQLVVHAIPPHISATIVLTSPPQPREDTPLKFFFTVPSIASARAAASALGGEVYREQWEGPGFHICNALDPEGNIFQIRENVP